MNGVKQFKRRSEAAPAELKSLTVRVPGSSANLGPGFDALALAYQLYCQLQFIVLPENDPAIPLVTLKGRLSEGLPLDRNNLIYSVLSDHWQCSPDLLQRLRITIESDIPLGKGVGSSAAAITGAVWAAYAFAGQGQDSRKILEKVSDLEGHADNAAASLIGGLVVSSMSSRSRAVITQKISWPDEWSTLVCVPSYALSTKKSRSLLPKQYAKADAVHNLQKVALLVAAASNRDEEAMREALHDRMHEPYRMELVPQLAAIRKVVADLPVIGCVLSGAGSSVLTVVHQRHKQQVLASLREWSRNYSEENEVLDLKVDQEGLMVSYQ